MKKIKYGNNPIYLVTAIIWLMVTMISIVTGLKLISNSLDIPGWLWIALGILQFGLSIYYFNITRRTYISIDENGFSIDRGIVRKIKLVEYSNIRKAIEIKNSIRISLEIGEVAKIDLNSLDDEDTSRMRKLLDDKGCTIEIFD